MIQICIFLFLPFTSVLAYPSNNKNIDGFELSNEFLIRHFGSDFKDAVRFNIQQTSLPNTGNILHKHFPAERVANRNFKRSYSLPTAQLVNQENRLPENFMKVQLLSPGEVEALERDIKGKGMYKSPIVVNLPQFGGMTPRNGFNHQTSPPFLPYAPKTTPVVYQNNLHSNFLPKNQGIWSQNPQFTAPSPSAIYQQPPRPFVMNTMQPSFQKFVINSLQPSHQINLHSKNEKIPLPQQANKIKTLVQPLFNKLVESPPQPTFNEKPSQEQLPYAQSTLEQSLSGQRFEEKINEPSLDQTTQASIEKTAPTTDKVQSSIDRIQPLTVELQPFSDKVQPLIDEMQPLIDEMQPLTHKIQPLTNKMQPSTTDKMQPSTDKMNSSSEKMEPSTDKFHLPTIDKMHQFPTENSQSSSELINPSDIAIQPFYRKVQATFEKTPDSYPNMRHLSYDDFISSYHSKPSIIDEHKEQKKHNKPSRYEDLPSFHNSRMMSFDKSSSSDGSRQSSYDTNFERGFDSFDGVKLEYRDGKKTNA